MLDHFNALPPRDAERQLRACCAAPRWVRDVASGRPYPSRAALRAAGEAALGRLTWGDVAEALAAHPRIGAPSAPSSSAPSALSGSRSGLEAEWSRREQAGTARSDPAVRSALAEANREYEARFGHIFLIFATGRSDVEMLTAARERLANPVEVERQVVRDELRRIVTLRLDRLVA
jgi:2-oxo-4-hydroxy-4-carboxy-5-ureidoimidazoline decarboxylase